MIKFFHNDLSLFLKTSSTQIGNVVIAIINTCSFDLLSEISWYVNECLNVSTTHAQTVLTCTGHSSCVNGSCETSTDSAHPFMYPYIKSEGYQYGVAPSGCDLID